jgi:hypothetical protein
VTFPKIELRVRHPLPALLGTDPSIEYQLAAGLGLAPRDACAAGRAGALCDPVTQPELAAIGQEYRWETATAESAS